jgi:OmpA-OmpF porin, OOP family
MRKILSMVVGMKKMVPMLLVAVFLLPLSGHAEIKAGSVEISPFAGYNFFENSQNLKDRPAFGGRIGYNITNHFGIEAAGEYIRSRVDDRSQSFSHEGQFTSPIDGVDISMYHLDLLYHFMPKGKFNPFIAAGYGIAHYSPKINTRNMSVLDFGVGAKYWIAENIALRLDVRDNLVTEFFQDSFHNVETTAGVVFRFGGKGTAVPVPPATTSSLSVRPGSIVKGEQATLNWSSQNATNCSMTPGVGSVDPQGSMTITPSTSTTYYLTCNGPGGTSNNSSSITVSEPPPAPLAPTSSLSVTPLSITKGEAASLAWTSSNAVKCDIQPGIGPVQPQGTIKITPVADSTYTLNCSGPGGTTTSMVNLAVVMPPPPAPVKRAPVVFIPEKEETVNLLIEFDFDKSVVKPEFYENVNAAGEFMQTYPTANLTVEGHTDSKGKNAYNRKLSQRRAEAVKKYIVEKFGIDAKRIKTVGYGETKPIDTNKTAEGRYHNRRVQAYHSAVK